MSQLRGTDSKYIPLCIFAQRTYRGVSDALSLLLLQPLVSYNASAHYSIDVADDVFIK